jgi:uncharacterized protein YbgA (DUF1722 family)/uncharacterized protein YbbK (DUF523 family)
MTEFARPRIVISKCIGFEACRYNGQIVRDSFVPRLEPHVDFVCVCPEVEIGLGTPRAPVRVVSSKDGFRLIQPETGLELTEKMRGFTSGFLDSLEEIDGFILKNRSPSCGIGDVKFYAGPEKAAALGRTSGFFGAAVLEKFGATAIEDEGRLNNLGIREHFLTRIFAFARFRAVQRSRSVHELVRFHAANKLLLMAYNQRKMRELGRIVANGDRLPAAIILQRYRECFAVALSKAPRHVSPVNALMHAFGYFKKELSPREKRHFLDVLDTYRLGTAPLSSAVSIIRSWIVRFETDYLQEQSFLDPFPEELMAADRSSRDRAVQAREKSS